MKIIIEIDCTDDAMMSDPIGELERILQTVPRKFEEQYGRAPGCLCNAPESADKLRDSNGNTVGSLTVI